MSREGWSSNDTRFRFVIALTGCPCEPALFCAMDAFYSLALRKPVATAQQSTIRCIRRRAEYARPVEENQNRLPGEQHVSRALRPDCHRPTPGASSRATGHWPTSDALPGGELRRARF